MSPHILALDIAGAPHRWINVRDAAHYYAADMIAWATGTNEFVLRGGTRRSTGEQSMIRTSSIIAIKGNDFMVRHFDHVPTLTKDMLLARDRYVCAYCAQRFGYDQAFQQLLARNSQDGLKLARTFLFDASGSIREIAIRRLLDAGERVEEIYAEALSASGGRAAVAVCALWGWGFMKSRARSDQVRGLLESPLPRVRRAALQAILQLLGDSARQFLVAALSDASPAVANEAARLVVRIDEGISVDQLIAIARSSGQRHVAIACCRVSRDMSKWSWLKFVLSVYGAPPFPVDQETLFEEVDAWNHLFNGSSAQPDACSLGDIAAALRMCEPRLKDGQAQLLRFTLRSYGVSQ